jgi:hypothetical protein
MEEMDMLADVLADFAPPPPASPEEGLYAELRSQKYDKMYNCHYWVRHQLRVLLAFNEELDWHLYKPAPVQATRKRVSTQETMRALLRYYFQMEMLPRFTSDRAKEMGKLVDLEKFITLVMEKDEAIKKLIENPRTLV